MAVAEELQVQHKQAVVNGVRLHYVEAGTGPLVVLLHGFPEFWWSWRSQIPALVEAGYRVIAPDQRGYAASEKPVGWRNYRIELLAADVAALIREAGEERAFVVGHDWGAAVAWMVATLHPEVVERLAILNVPHPDTMQRTLMRNPKQLLHSWYMFFFQLPWLPERLLGWGGRDALARTYGDAREGAFTDADLDRYVEALHGPEGFRGPINWYRAALRTPIGRARRLYRPIPAEVLVIWGEQDRFLTASMAQPSPELVPHVRVERLPDASHWVQHDEPERVNALLTGFFGAAA
jgi:pimeloyl-ACP methyl ester carboxylesterase